MFDEYFNIIICCFVLNSGICLEFFLKKIVAVTLKKETKSNDLIINPGVTYFSETSMSLNTNCFNVQNVLITFFKKTCLNCV